MAPSTSSVAVRHVVLACALFLVAAHLLAPVEARYLPTRSQDDRLERLRELLKDLLEGELERPSPQANLYDKRIFVKRDVGPALHSAAAAGPLPSSDEHVRVPVAQHH